MRLNQLISLNALITLILGIAFALYGPLMLAFFGVPEIETTSAGEEFALLYWQVASFARLFGAILFAFGLILWALRKFPLESAISTDLRNGLLASLILGNLMAAFVSLTQQASIWISSTGWLLFVIFAFFVLAYGYFLVKKPKPITQTDL